MFKLLKKTWFCLNLSWTLLGRKCDSGLIICWLVLLPSFGKTLIPAACFHGCVFPALWHTAVAGNQSGFLKERRDWARRALNTNNFQHGLVQKIAWIKWEISAKGKLFCCGCIRTRLVTAGPVWRGQRDQKRRGRKALLSGVKKGKKYQPCSVWDFSG